MFPRLLPALFAGLVSPVFASDLVVAPGQSIQRAIDAAADGDRILLQPGTYREALDFRGKAIDLIGVGGAPATVLDGEGNGPLIRMHAGEGPATRLKGLTLQGGYNLSSEFLGGGVSGIVVGSPVPPASPTIEDCRILGNTAFRGGGVAADATIVRTVIHDNTSVGGNGGGVFGAFRMRDCVLAENWATQGNGGGAAIEGGAAKIERCSFYENKSYHGAFGGGLYVGPDGGGRVQRSVFAVNDAHSTDVPANGGAVYADALSAGLVIDRCTIVDNEVGIGTTGGVFGPVVITNSILYENWGTPSEGQLGGGAQATYSDVEHGAPGLGNFDAPPSFVAGYLSEHDYHLKPGSPCIDAGDPSRTDHDGSVLDVGAFPLASHYPRAAKPSLIWVEQTWPQVSAQIGGKARYRIHAGAAEGGKVYLVLGSLRGSTPGTTFLGVPVPLAADKLFRYLAGHPNQPPYGATLGFLDASGVAEWTFTAPPVALSGGIGWTLHYAAVVLDPVALTASVATDAAPLRVVP